MDTAVDQSEGTSSLEAETSMIKNGTSKGDDDREDSTQDVGVGEKKGLVVDDRATYTNLIRTNRAFRLIFSGWILSECAEWFEYIAALSLVKRLVDDPESDRTAVAILVAVWLLPSILFSGIGGVLADSRDRRISMIQLDLAAAAVTLLYLVALQCESIFFVYLVSFLTQTTSALYEPCGSAIFPMLVPNEEYLKKATTLYVFGESLMGTLGPALGGLCLATLGMRACFVIDSILCLCGALLTWMVGGTWDPNDESSSSSSSSSSDDESSSSDDEENQDGESSEESSSSSSEDDPYADKSFLQRFTGMTVDGVVYLRGTFFGPLVLLSSSAALIYGSLDVLEVSFSERGENEDENSLRLGLLFAFSGVGCILGTMITELFSDMKDLKKLQNLCVWSFFFIALSFLGMGVFPSFASPCFFTVVDSAAATLLYIVSDLILQVLVEPRMMGRVVAMDATLGTSTEALSALIAGVLQDNVGLSAQGVSLVMSGVGGLIFLSWLAYHLAGGGAASQAAKDFKSHYSKAKLAAENESSEQDEEQPPATEATPLLLQKPVASA